MIKENLPKHQPFGGYTMVDNTQHGILSKKYFIIKKTLSNLLAVALLAIALAACSTAPATPTESVDPPATVTAAAPVVTFSDPVLEAMVRGAMGKPQGDILVSEAQALTTLNLSIELQQIVSEGTPITNIDGLKNFTNLESLDLSFHAIPDISPLAGLNKLTTLSLKGNPVADITPLAGLTNLKALILSNCAAQDYSPLAKLVNLQFLMLDHSTIADASLLASLTNLKQLYLEGSLVDDYAPLETIYPNLEKRDFSIASTLQELGFMMDYDKKMANYSDQSLSVLINHSNWGLPQDEWYMNCVWMTLQMEDGYTLNVGLYPDLDTYVFMIFKDEEMLMNYLYDEANDNLMLNPDDRENTEQVIRKALGDVATEDIFLTPIPIFLDTIKNNLGMSADALFALPFEPPSLKSLGFYPDEANAVWLYEWRQGNDVNMEVHRPEWGEKDYDVRFFTPISEEYRIVVTYLVDERKYSAGIDDNDGGGATFDFYLDTNKYVDGWCSDKNMTVEEYLIKAYNDPQITDVYQHSVALVEQFIGDTFGVTIDELYALPTEN